MQNYAKIKKNIKIKRFNKKLSLAIKNDKTLEWAHSGVSILLCSS